MSSLENKIQSRLPLKLREAFAARHEPEAQRILGSLYWACLVILSALLIISSIGLGVWEFTQPLESRDTSTSIGNKKTLSRADVEKVLDVFDARAKLYESRTTAPVLVRDPS